MNAELLEKARWAASTARNRNGSESDAVAAAVRVAVEVCAEICDRERLRLLEVIRAGNFSQAVDAVPRSYQAQVDALLIRALLD